MKVPPLHLTACLVGILFADISISSLSAAPYYWNTTNGAWEDPTKWSNNATSGGTTGTVPLATDTAFFNQTSVNGAEIITLAGPTSIAGLTFLNTGTTAIRSDTTTTRALTIGTGGITINTAAQVTIGNATNGVEITLGGSQSWTNNSGTALSVINNVALGGHTLTLAGFTMPTFTGAITGVGSLTQANGTLVLTNTGNSYTGATTLSTAGTLRLGASGVLPDGTVVTFGAASNEVRFELNGFNETIGGLSGGGTGAPYKNSIIQVAESGSTSNSILTINQATDTTFDGIIRNGGGTGVLSLVKQGAGNLILKNTAGDDTTRYTGTTTISGGTLTLSDSTERLINSFASDIINNSQLVLEVRDSTPRTFSRVISGSGQLAVGTYSNTALILSNTSNSYTGSTVIGAGNLRLGASGVITDVSIVRIATYAKLELNGFNETIGGLTNWGTVDSAAPAVVQVSEVAASALNSTLTVNQATDLTFEGILRNSASGSGNVLSLTKQGAGNLTLKNTHATVDINYTGTTTISGGTLTLSDSTGRVIPNFASNITNNATLALENTGATPRIFAQTISGSGNLIITAANTGTLTLSAANTYLGGTTVNAGTLILGASERLANTGAVAVSGGTFNLGTFSETVGAVTLSSGTISNGTLTGTSYSATNSGAISAILAGSGVAFTKTGAGTVTLSGANTYTGATSISAGTLSASNIVVSGGNSHLGNAVSAVSLGAGATKGTLSYTGNTATYTRGFTIGNGGGQLDVTTSGQTLTVGSGAITGTAGLLTVGGAGNTIISSAITTGTGGLTKTGAGTLTLSNSGNTFTGLTTVTEGTLLYAAINALASGAVTVNGGTLNLGSTSDTMGAVTLSSGTITNGELTGTSIAVESGSISAILAGGGALTKSTGGTVTLSGANTYTGGTAINAGTLALSGTGRLADTGAVTVSSGTLDLGGVSDTVGAVILNSGTISNGTLTSSAGYSATDTGAVSAVLAGSGAFTKTGAGSVTFSAANTYTGNTIVSAGGLILSGSGSVASNLIQVQQGASLNASAVTGGVYQLQSGQTLENKGTFTGNLTALSGSTYAPGNSPGIANQAGNLTLNTGSIFEWELIANTSAGAGTNFDQTLFSTGGLTIQTGVTANLVFDAGSTVDWADAFWSSNQQWLVFTGATSLSNVPEIFTTLNVSVDSEGNTLAPSQGSFSFTNVGNEVYLTYTIPEPSTTLLLAGALMALVIFRRRRA